MNPRCDILLRRQLARIPSVRERALRKSSERAGWSRQPWSHSPVKLQRDCQGAWQKLSPASSGAFCSISTFGRMPQLGGGHCRGTRKQSTAAVRPRLGLLREGPSPPLPCAGSALPALCHQVVYDRAEESPGRGPAPKPTGRKQNSLQQLAAVKFDGHRFGFSRALIAARQTCQCQSSDVVGEAEMVGATRRDSCCKAKL